MESFLSMSIHNVFSWPISTFLHFSRIGKPVLDTGTLGAPIYYIVVGWIAHSRPTYMLAGTLGVCIIISGPKHYMWLKDIISAEIGWNAICGHFTHMKIFL